MTETWGGIERRSGTKRRCKRRYRFIDRRLGFDRRRRYHVLGTMRDHPWILVGVIVLLNLFSLIDGLFTAAELGLGIATEGNPVLLAAGQWHPLLAVAVKISGLVVASVGFWHGRRHRFILGLSLVALGAFVALVAFHWSTLAGRGWL